jgi:hypothetical protein
LVAEVLSSQLFLQTQARMLAMTKRADLIRQAAALVRRTPQCAALGEGGP